MCLESSFTLAVVAFTAGCASLELELELELRLKLKLDWKSRL